MSYIDSNISNHLPKITLDYINEEKKLNPFYNRPNNIDNYKSQFDEKINQYNNDYVLCSDEPFKTEFERFNYLAFCSDDEKSLKIHIFDYHSYLKSNSNFY